MHSSTILSFLVGMTVSMPLTTRQADEIIYELPIFLHGGTKANVAAVGATAEHVGSTDIIHLDPIGLPNLNVDTSMLANGFDLDVKANISGVSIEFPIRIHQLDTKEVAKRQESISLGGFTLPSMDFNFDGIVDGFKWDFDLPIGDISISIPPIQINSKRQANFFDEVIDVTIEVGKIVVNSKRSVEKRQKDISLFNGAVQLTDIKVDVSLLDKSISIPIGH